MTATADALGHPELDGLDVTQRQALYEAVVQEMIRVRRAATLSAMPGVASLVGLFLCHVWEGLHMHGSESLYMLWAHGPLHLQAAPCQRPQSNRPGLLFRHGLKDVLILIWHGLRGPCQCPFIHGHLSFSHAPDTHWHHR